MEETLISQPAPEVRLISRDPLINDTESLLNPTRHDDSGKDLDNGEPEVKELLNDSKEIRKSESGVTGWRRIATTRNPRFGLGACVALSYTVLLINVLFAIVVCARFRIQDGVGTLFDGSCMTVDNWSTGLHLAINILSSLILAASSYVMQIISAPTRYELDKAHQRGDWLDIGVLSFRNVFRRTSNRGRFLWILLALSSLPIHLLYNSAIFKKTVGFTYLSSLVRPDFATAVMNITANSIGGELGPLLFSTLQFFANAETNYLLVENLTVPGCIAAYGVPWVYQRSDVLLISDCALESSADYPFSSIGGGVTLPNAWLCDDSNCPNGAELPSPTNWTINGCTVDYCLSRREETTCKLESSLYILLAVILCNVTKAVVMTWTLVFYRQDALLTLGDAIASYLEHPDQPSSGNCMATKDSIQMQRYARQSARQLDPRPPPLRICPTRTRFWGSAASGVRWTITLGLCFATLAVTSYLLYLGTEGVIENGGEPWQLGFGELTADSATYFPSTGFAFVLWVVVANIPQIAVSFLYVSYNGLWTIMLLASEWNGYYLRPHSLRVTYPKGQQRSTYLPYRFSIPLLTAITILHWLISESLFAAQVLIKNDSVIQASGVSTQEGTYVLIAWSNRPILSSIILGALMVFAVILVAFRKFPNPMPLASSCSLAIAAACHAPSDDENTALLPVSWGAVGPTNADVGHCCFTTQYVHEPIPGRLYA